LGINGANDAAAASGVSDDDEESSTLHRVKWTSYPPPTAASCGSSQSGSSNISSLRQGPGQPVSGQRGGGTGEVFITSVTEEAGGRVLLSNGHAFENIARKGSLATQRDVRVVVQELPGRGSGGSPGSGAGAAGSPFSPDSSAAAGSNHHAAHHSIIPFHHTMIFFHVVYYNLGMMSGCTTIFFTLPGLNLASVTYNLHI
jgi:hypothetical protein